MFCLGFLSIKSGHLLPNCRSWKFDRKAAFEQVASIKNLDLSDHFVRCLSFRFRKRKTCKNSVPKFQGGSFQFIHSQFKCYKCIGLLSRFLFLIVLDFVIRIGLIINRHLYTATYRKTRTGARRGEKSTNWSGILRWVLRISWWRRSVVVSTWLIDTGPG